MSSSIDVARSCEKFFKMRSMMKYFIAQSLEDLQSFKIKIEMQLLRLLNSSCNAWNSFQSDTELGKA